MYIMIIYTDILYIYILIICTIYIIWHIYIYVCHNDNIQGRNAASNLIMGGLLLANVQNPDSWKHQNVCLDFSK